MEVKTANQQGITRTGEAPRLYSIENKQHTKLVVSDFGAAVVSLFVAGRNGVLQDVVLGYENTTDYLGDDFYLGTVVGRYANRISGDTVVIDQEAYKLFTKDGSYHLHGGKSGFNKKYYHAVPFQHEDSAGIVFSYTSPHLEEGFPGTMELEITYTLCDDNAWTIEYKAVSDKTTLINLTQHAYFNLTGDLSKKIDDHELQINAREYLPVNNLQVPTGELCTVTGTVFDFTKFKLIGADIDKNDEQLILSNGYDHSFVLEKTHTQTLKHAATVCDPLSGRKMEVLTTEPAVHFYSGNFLSGLKGKNQVAYHERSGFCLETQHFPDAPKHKHFPSTVLHAGEQYYSKTVFRFSTSE